MNTRTYPRTLEQAFGPYARGPVYSKPEPMNLADRVVLFASAVAVVTLLGFMVVGWVK